MCAHFLQNHKGFALLHRGYLRIQNKIRKGTYRPLFLRDFPLTLLAHRCPAFTYGVAYTLGNVWALLSPWALLPWVVWLGLTPPKKRLGVLLVFLFPLCVLTQFYTFPTHGQEVEGIFHIRERKPPSKYGGYTISHGELWIGHKRLLLKVISSSSFSADYAYPLRGKVSTREGRWYTLKQPLLGEPLYQYPSRAAWRATLHTSLARWIRTHFPGENSGPFFSGLVTGQLEEDVLWQAFSNVGLSHFLAISGFHFALLLGICHSLLRLLLPSKIEAMLLLLIATAYYIFLGPSSSVERAWIATTVFLGGVLLDRTTSPLNTLGVALGLSQFLHPLSVLTLSFQLSFAATGGLLLFYPLCLRLLTAWIPAVSKAYLSQKPWWWQLGYTGAAFLRRGLALACAIHIPLWILLWTHTHTLSGTGFLYNLFLPACLSVLLLLFLVSLPLGCTAHHLVDTIAERLLSFVTHPPLLLKSVYLGEIAPMWTALFFAVLLGGASAAFANQASVKKIS